MLGSRFKDFTRTRPRLYDTLKSMKRRLRAQHDDPAFQFFDTYSKLRGKRLNFVQIGANDGLRNDPFREFIVRDRWQGILVEPLPTVFTMLKRNYAHLADHLVFVNAAITQADGDNLTFYSFDEAFLKTLTLEKRLDYLRKASFNREHVEHYVSAAERWGIKETTVRGITLQGLIAEYGGGMDVDLLAIDAEGHEPAIIRSIDFEKVRPQVIFYESHTLAERREEVRAFLQERGYRHFDILGDSVAMLPPALEEFKTRAAPSFLARTGL